jgi:hypothetical protein
MTSTAAPLPTLGAGEVLIDARTIPSSPPAPECAPPLRVSPKALAISWSTYLGRRVLLMCRPVRRIDLVRTLVVADGAMFIATGPSDVTPCSKKTSTFVVLGSTVSPLFGKTSVPELLLEEEGGCSQ